MLKEVSRISNGGRDQCIGSGIQYKSQATNSQIGISLAKPPLVSSI